MSDITSNRARTVRVHITQDDFGYWMTTLERDDGSLTLSACAMQFADAALRDAYDPRAAGLPPDAEFLISEPAVPLRLGDPRWSNPPPRRAREPYVIVRHGKKVD